MNFANEKTKAEVAQILKSVKQISIKNVGKIKSKIMICNMHKEETKKEVKKETILDRNDFLWTIQGVENKTELKPMIMIYRHKEET